MAATCISSCVDDARVPVRASYVNLYKWPESEFEFVRSMSSSSRNGGGGKIPVYGHPRVVDSISCRQMYLRSYTFSREEDYKEEKTALKCLGRRREKPADKARKRRSSGARRGSGRDGASARLKKAKSVSCSALAYIFRRLLSCTTDIDVAN